MTDSEQIMEAMDRRVERRNERRDLFKMALGTAVAGTAFAYASTAAAQAATPSEPDVLNFALNLEYLEAQFYSYAARGEGLTAAQTSGSTTTGAQGAVAGIGTATGPRRVNFTDPVIARYAQEIAADEIAHVNFLRTALGPAAVAQPAINISAGPGGAFTAAATAAGVQNAAAFDPYADDISFLLGAFIFEDVGVSAYKGASPLLTTPGTLEAAAGILAVEAYHAAIVRTVLYQRGVATPSIRTTADQISAARDSLDGPDRKDQGISPTTGVNGQLVSNIVPLDADGIAYSRSPGQVLNIVYLNRAAVTLGGFFPAGVNGAIRASAAN